MTTMKLELPLLTYATQLEIDYLANGLTCPDFYTSEYKATSDIASLLCANSTYDFSDTYLSSFANINMMLYGKVFNPKYYQMFMEITNVTSTQFDTYMTKFGKSSIYSSAISSVKAHYSLECTSELVSQCAFSNLTYNQWLSGSLLSNPLPS